MGGRVTFPLARFHARNGLLWAAIPTPLFDFIEIDPPWGRGGEWVVEWVGIMKDFFDSLYRSKNIWITDCN